MAFQCISYVTVNWVCKMSSRPTFGAVGVSVSMALVSILASFITAAAFWWRRFLFLTLPMADGMVQLGRKRHWTLFIAHPQAVGKTMPIAALAITSSHHQNTHVFAHGRKNMNDIFNNYVCSASHMRPELHFQNVWREPCYRMGCLSHTVQCRDNTVNFLQNHHNRHPIACPWGWAMGVFCDCSLWYMFCFSHCCAVWKII